MLISSHLIFADILYEGIFHCQPFSAPILQFRFGNIKPDLGSKLIGREHYHYKTYSFLTDLIEKLVTEPCSTANYVENCGIVTHLVADYFCKYHFYSRFYKKSIIEHARYEYSLHKVLLKMKRTRMLPLRGDRTFISVTTLFNNIASLQTQYAKLPDNPAKDIAFALQASKTALNSIIAITKMNMLKNETYQNAASYQ